MVGTQVFVNVGDGTTVAVEVQPWQTIGEVKGVVLLPRIRLSCGGDDDNSVVFYLSMAGIQWQVQVLCSAKVWHVLSAQAMKEVDSTSCVVCHTPFTDADKIPINGNEELLALRERMEADKARIQEKKEKSTKTAKTNLAEYKVAERMSANATKSVYTSIFTFSSKGTLKETCSCQSLPL
ncbi:unnamed protein product [Sphagnum compactum]